MDFEQYLCDLGFQCDSIISFCCNYCLYIFFFYRLLIMFEMSFVNAFFSFQKNYLKSMKKIKILLEVSILRFGAKKTNI